MADLILGPVVDATLSNVIAAASNQLNLALEWNHDLKRFCLILKMLQSVLQDADEKNVSGDSHLKSWLQELRAIADEADDLLEEVAYQNLKRQLATQKPKWKKVRYFLTLSNPLLFRIRMANRIKNLSIYLADINDWATRLGLQYKLGNMVPEPRVGPDTHSFLPTPVAGRTKDVSKIVSLLVDSSNNQHELPVITIVGMPGLGKTALARAVLENDEIGEHFGKNIMWVCVSENFNVKRILMEMLKSISESRSGDGDIGSKDSVDIGSKDNVMKLIQKRLREKNYLLILDDVWNEKQQNWEELRNCLLGVSKIKGCRVLVTTRLENVASLMAVTNKHIHRPMQLNEDECWAIIKQRAFGENSVPEGLEGIGKQIAKGCKGVPLVASVIGATLQNKRDKKEWLAITENHVWDSLEKENGILDIIKFSYDRLPKLALKQCFAFCSIFPKDFVMRRDMLIQLWVAQGFLESSEESCMAAEEMGDKYFNYLLSYSLFQEEQWDFVTGSVISCKMHDLIHDFAKSVSNFETLIVEEQLGSNISHHVRHLNLIDGRKMVPTILGDVAKKLQTLFSKHGFSSDVQVDLKRLRVLSLDGASDAKQLPTCFGKSKSLRYLDISRTQVEELPKFITKLYNLQTFRFTDCKSLKMPARGIGDLINLRHIYFNDKERMPANLGRLTNLQTLTQFFVGATKGHKIEELGGLNGLRGRLEICNLKLVKGKSEAEGANLHEKAVEDLRLCWKGEGSQDNDEEVLEGLQPHSNLRRLSIVEYRGRNLASWMSNNIEELLLLNNLVELTVRICWKLERIPGINGFSSLQSLCIRNCDELTSLGDGALTLKSLKVLFISRCPKLESFSVSGLSSLQRLTVGDCRELTSLGEGDGALMSLEELYLAECYKLDSFRVSGLSSLVKLRISSCSKISNIGNSLSSSMCLKQLYLNQCSALEFIPDLKGLVSLKTVSIQNCGGLERLPSGLSSCVALEELQIRGCSNLVSIPEELKQLRSLVKLDIEACQKLRSFPKEIMDFLGSLERLKLGPFSEELKEFPNLSSNSTLDSSLKQLCLEGWGEVTLPNQIQRLIALTDLTIRRFNGVEEALSENLSCLKILIICDCELRCLSSRLLSLEELRIANCSNMVSFQGQWKELRFLTISQCPQLDFFQGELKELHSLTIKECPKLVGFVEESLSCCTRLKTLVIGRFSEELEEFPSLSSIHASIEDLALSGWEKLTHLPQIQHLSALKELKIWGFKGIKSLPDWFNNLSSLQRLYITDCPDELKEKCTKGSDPEWHKISHIPHIEINLQLIQSQD